MNKDITTTSSDILQLLSCKHSEDLFVPECKNGSTWFQHHSRVDAWVMKKSWVNMKYIGYEIKISRSDFRSDSKYVNYLEMCNDLYFVCPWDMIQVSEIPLEVGLMYVSKNCTRLITRKKAVSRNIDDPVSTLLYILMCRTRVTSEVNNLDNLSYWKNYLSSKKESFDIGRSSSKKLKKEHNELVYESKKKSDSVNKENENLKNQLKSVDYAVNKLQEMGIDINCYDFKKNREYGIDGLLRKLTTLEQDEFKKVVRMASINLRSICDKLEIN